MIYDIRTGKPMTELDLFVRRVMIEVNRRMDTESKQIDQQNSIINRNPKRADRPNCADCEKYPP